jgi:N-acyl-phosphatidylethanolamine-hydrolysing phospholipase D
MRERAPDGGLEAIPFPTRDDYSRAFPLQSPVDLSGFPAARDQVQGQKEPPSSSANDNTIRAIWIGHACVLARLNGLTFLTDPALSERCSPLPFAGPRRVVPPALTAPTLPHVDAVLLSHNHYDHLDTATVRALHARFGPGGSAADPTGKHAPLRWFVPLGLKSWFVSVLGENVAPWVVELDWWQGDAALFDAGGSASKRGGDEDGSGDGLGTAAPTDATTTPQHQTRVVLVPAQHWSARGAFDRRATLWGGFAVVGPNGRFYFAGDTGHCPAFREIGARLGPFDLSAIPTGAYEPRDFMRAQHIGPEEAVDVHVEVRSKRSIAVHCCTWCLTLEPLDEPPRRLKRAVVAKGLEADAFVTLRHGAAVSVAEGRWCEAPVTLPVLEQGEEVKEERGKAATVEAGAASTRASVALRAEARGAAAEAPEQAARAVGE